MVVKTVDNVELQNLCNQLAYKVFKSSFHPDCILAIPNGGTKPAELVRDYLCQLFCDTSIKMISVTGKHKNKNAIISRLLKHLPLWLLNVLRLISLKVKRVVPSVKSWRLEVDIPDRCKNILIVDDAVDTGKTLMSISKILSERFNVKSAALTVTIHKPMVYPDYFLFNNETILRLPWARDAK